MRTLRINCSVMTFFLVLFNSVAFNIKFNSLVLSVKSVSEVCHRSGSFSEKIIDRTGVKDSWRNSALR